MNTRLLPVFCTLILTVTTAKADEFSGLNSKLINQKLAMETRHALEISELKQLNEEKVDHMQHLMLHKIEFSRSGKIPAAHQLVAKKAAATIADIRQLGDTDILPEQQAERIQLAMVHKMHHMQDETYFVSFK